MNPASQCDNKKKKSSTNIHKPSKATLAIKSPPTEHGRSIRDAPLEILVHVFSFLEPATLACAAQTCKIWNRVVHDESCWRSAFIRNFGAPPFLRLAAESWKSEYILRAKLLRAWEGTRPASSTFVDPHIGRIDDVQVDFDAGWIIVGSIERGRVVRCDPFTGKLYRSSVQIGSEDDSIQVSAIKIESNRTVFGYRNGQISVSWCTRRSTSNEVDLSALRTFSGQHLGPVTCVETIQSENYLALSAGEDGNVRIWDFIAGRSAMNLIGANGTITHLLVDREHVVAGTINGHIFIWDLDSISVCTATTPQTTMDRLPPVELGLEAETRTMPFSRQINVRNIGGSHSGRGITYPILNMPHDRLNKTVVVALEGSHEFRRYSIQTGGLIEIYQGGHVRALSCLKLYTPTGHKSTSGRSSTDGSKLSTLIASGDAVGTVCLWDSLVGETSVLNAVKSIKPVRTFSAHLGPVSCISVDPVKIASAGSDGSVKIWDPLTGKLLRCLNDRHHRSQPGEVADPRRSVTFLYTTAYQVLMASASSIKIWDHSNHAARLGKPKHRLNMRSVMGTGSGLGGVINNPKRQLHYDIKTDIRETTSRLEEERVEKQRESNRRARLNPLGLSEEELLDYALMLSREGAESQQMQLAQDENAPSDQLLSRSVQNDVDLMAALIESEAAIQKISIESMSPASPIGQSPNEKFMMTSRQSIDGSATRTVQVSETRRASLPDSWAAIAASPPPNGFVPAVGSSGPSFGQSPRNIGQWAPPHSAGWSGSSPGPVVIGGWGMYKRSRQRGGTPGSSDPIDRDEEWEQMGRKMSASSRRRVLASTPPTGLESRMNQSSAQISSDNRNSNAVPREDWETDYMRSQPLSYEEELALVLQVSMQEQ